MGWTSLGRGAALVAAALAAGCTEAPRAPARPQVVSRLQVRGDGAGSALAFTVVPDAKDGVSNRNPPGTVEVFSAGTATPVLTVVGGGQPGNLCGANPGIHATVTVKNYATEQLRDVAVEFTEVVPGTHNVCNPPPPPASLPPETGVGVIGYAAALGGSPVPDGSQPGGAATEDWWFNYQAGGSFSFKAKVWADVVPAPPTSPAPADGAVVDALAAPVTLSWAGSTPDGFLKVWTHPSLADPYLVVSTEVVSASALQVDPAAYAEETTYHWRAGNRFPLDGAGPVVNGTFTVGGAYRVARRPVWLQPDPLSFGTPGSPPLLPGAGAELVAEVSAFAEGGEFSICPVPFDPPPWPDCTAANRVEGGAGTALGAGQLRYTTLGLGGGHFRVSAQTRANGGLLAGSLAESRFYVDGPLAGLHTVPATPFSGDAVSLQATTSAPWVRFWHCAAGVNCLDEANWALVDEQPADAAGLAAGSLGPGLAEGTHGWRACNFYPEPLLDGACAQSSFLVVLP